MNNFEKLEAIADCPFCECSTARVCELDVDMWAVTCIQCKAIGPSAKSEIDALKKWASRSLKRHLINS